MAIWNRTEQILKNQTSSRHEIYRSWRKKKAKCRSKQFRCSLQAHCAETLAVKGTHRTSYSVVMREMGAIGPSNPCPEKIHKSEKGWEMQFSCKVWMKPNGIWWSVVGEKTEYKSRWVHEDELGKGEHGCPSSLLRWVVPRHSVWQQPLAWDPTWRPCPRRDGCCVQYYLLSVKFIISSGRSPWGTYELGWDFGLSFSLSLFLPRAFPQPLPNAHLYCAARGSVFIHFLLHRLLQYKVRNDTAPQSWQLATQKDFISSSRGQWQDSVTLEVLKDNSMPY